MGQPRINPCYLESISQVIKYVDDNLEQDLSIDRLAEVALFSKFHFHRIFKGATGETLNGFVKRRRLERAVRLFKFHPELSVTDVYLRVGFNSSEHFSRSFRERFDITPREFKSADPNDLSSVKNSKIYQVLSEDSFYHIYQQSRESPNFDFEVCVRNRKETPMASIAEKYGRDGSNLVVAYEELIEWAKEKNLYSPDVPRFALSKDDIEVTPAELYCMEFGIEVPAGTIGMGRVKIGSLIGAEYALARIQGDIHRVAQGWDYIYKHWLPSSRYRPADHPAVEIFLQGPETLGWDQFDIEIGFPVEKIITSNQTRK